MGGDREEIDVAALLPRVLAGDEDAWAELMSRVWPAVTRQVARSRTLGPWRDSEDDRNEVASLVFARLRRDGHRALRLHGPWQARHPDKTFTDWLAIVTANVARDYVGQRLAAGTMVDKLIDTLTASLDERGGAGAVRPAYTNGAASRALLERAARMLPEDQAGPLDAWLKGSGFDEIAARYDLADEKQAQARVRAALARLRHAVRG